MVIVAQLVRASDCGSEGRGFEPHLSPLVREEVLILFKASFVFYDNKFINNSYYICVQ